MNGTCILSLLPNMDTQYTKYGETFISTYYPDSGACGIYAVETGSWCENLDRADHYSAPVPSMTHDT